MKKILFFLVFAFAISKMQAQFVYKIKADSLLVTNDSCTAELNLENSTKNVKGFLYNKGNGRTEFRKAVRLNDSVLVIGGDTFLIRGAGGGANFANTNLTFTDHRHHNLAGKTLTMTSNALPGGFPGGTEYLQGSGTFDLLAYEDTSNRFSKAYSFIEVSSAYNFMISGDYNYFKSESTVNTSADAAWMNSSSLLTGRKNEIYIDTTRIEFNSYKDSVYKFYPIKEGSDTTGFKPLIVDSDGYIHKLTNWPSTLASNNGLSITGKNVQLGQSIGASGSPAALSNDREIPLNGFNTNFSGNGKIGIGTTSPLDKVHVAGTARITDTLKLVNIASKSDTTNYKPMIADASGNVFKMNGWPAAPLTLQQVTSYGNATSNTIKPFPNALPVGASADSLVVWSSADSLLKKVGSIGSLTLQQVTTNGNTTTNKIKPYPAALPVGASTDSVVVWSSADSLLKKVGSIQTFDQTATATISASTVETTLTSSGSGSLTIPAASWFAGKTFNLVIHGTYSTSASNPANLTIKIKLGTTIIAQNSIFLGSGKSNIPFEIRAELTCRTTGSSGTVYTMGMVNSGDDWVTQLDNGTSATTVNLSTSQTLNITATLNDNHTGNVVSAYMVLLNAMN